MTAVLVGDIGGTNARLAVYQIEGIEFTEDMDDAFHREVMEGG